MLISNFKRNDLDKIYGILFTYFVYMLIWLCNSDSFQLTLRLGKALDS